MARDRTPAMQFYFRQFCGDEAVMLMDLDAVGSHILLMCSAGASQFGYKILNDERKIKTLLRNPKEEDFARIKSQLLDGAWKLSEDGLWWIQDGMRRTLMKQKEFLRLQSEKGIKSAAKKHLNRTSTELQPNFNRDVDRTSTDMPTESQPSSASASASASALKPNTLGHQKAVTEFANFWESYPRKIHKPETQKVWRKLRISNGNFQTLMDGLARWIDSDSWADKKFIPYPVKFLSNRQWEDIPPERELTAAEREARVGLGPEIRLPPMTQAERESHERKMKFRFECRRDYDIFKANGKIPKGMDLSTWRKKREAEEYPNGF
jgi:hypothetical protein